MARVIGLGGVFFKSKDPEKLGEWYKKWLSVPVEHPYGASFKSDGMPAGSLSVWTPFKESTEYFDPSARDYIFNLIVDDLGGALSQVTEGGAKLVGEIDESEFGRFGWFLDPEGNKVELWEPPKP
jgi:predicted enzyme related to lactoylglutathione lyase